MRVYLDASVITSLLFDDVFSQRASKILSTHNDIIISDWAALEVSSVIARQFRTSAITAHDAQEAYATIDILRAKASAQAVSTPHDIVVASEFVRSLIHNLRAPDALHLAIAQRLEAALVTFDVKMAMAAEALNLSIIS